jgi:hypothetical protein
MKKLLLGIALATAATVGYSQNLNSIFNDIGAALANAPWDFVAGGGVATTGQNKIAFSDIACNFASSTNGASVGIVIGGDYLWNKHGSSWNTVKGGITLKGTIRPFAFLGGTNWFTNLKGTLFAADCMAQPGGGSSAPIGNIITGGIQFRLASYKQFDFGIGGQYENRSGQGNWNGNYVLGQLSISRTF